MTLRTRRTDMTIHQRQALEQARQLLAPHFAGETVRVWVPKTVSAERQAREQRIADALAAGLDARSVSRQEDVSLRHLRRIRQRGQVPP